MATINQFEDIQVWQKSRELCQKIYETSSNQSFSQDFALKNQIRRSSGSIMDNIAEGFERGGTKEFIHYLFIAKGSAGEVRSQLYRAYDSAYISENELNNLINEVRSIGGMLMNFITYLKNTDISGPKFK